MVDTSYSVIPGASGGFDVHMVRPNGSAKTATGFGSEHEAVAWIVQAKRMKRDAAPWTPLEPRRPGAVAAPRNTSLPPAGVPGPSGGDVGSGDDDVVPLDAPATETPPDHSVAKR